MLRELVRKLAAQGKTILLSSHVMEVVEKICSRVVILSKGRVAADDSVERLRELMRLPSLEEIFARLTQEFSTETFANRIVEAMQA
jgi:ABC-2 type transport system ATP-binding protein